MKALSLWQPWASLVALGEKQIETRSWTTRYRGPLAIHAAAKIPGTFLGRSRFAPDFGQELAALNIKPDELPRGAILCVVELIAVDPVEQVRQDISHRERVFGNYEDGRYAWHTRLVETFPTPIPAKGNRLLWEWPHVDA